MLISSQKQTLSCLVMQVFALRLGRDILLLETSLVLQLLLSLNFCSNLFRFLALDCPKDAVKTDTSR
jgi:hypothetical protein